MAIKPPADFKSSEDTLQQKNKKTAKETTTTLGDRFRQARALVPLSRMAFCLKHDINTYTLQSWENDRYSSRSGNVIRFCQALAREGIVCTEEWLIKGTGPKPYHNPSIGSITYCPAISARRLATKAASLPEKLACAEAAFFQKNCGKEGLESVVVQVADEAMQPDYKKGEFIGAIKVAKDQGEEEKDKDATLPFYHQSVCVVETRPHYFLIRRVLKEDHKYILVANSRGCPLLSLDEVSSIYEIVWQRKVRFGSLAEDQPASAGQDVPKGRKLSGNKDNRQKKLKLP